MLESIPLNKLDLSPANVRKTNGDEDIPGLADSIASKGLLQNLVVTPAPGKGKRFLVDAGGRRLRALKLCAERKVLPANWPVPCKVIAAADARQASLAENLQKVAMNPADEVEAFDALIQDWTRDGMDQATAIANCSKRFGVTERYVRQRLALAALAPEILDALRDGRITIGTASAYASHPDPKEQLKVFTSHEKRTGTYGKHDARTIRDELNGRFYPIDHKLVRYIGIDAYRAAGGETATDLFFHEDEREIALDMALVERLAREKGETEAQRLAQDAGWLDAVLAPFTGWSVPAPEGYVREWHGAVGLTAKARAEAIAYFSIRDDATLVQDADTYFVREHAEDDDDDIDARRALSNAEYEARRRAALIRYRAARLAAPKVAGTELEGRAFWPADGARWIDPFQVDEAAGLATVALLVKIPLADVDAQLEEAERRYELEQQELREEDEALAAEDAEDDGTGDNPPDEALEFEPDAGEDLEPNVNDQAADVEPETV